MTLTEQRITALRKAGIVVRDDCWCGLCTWAREEPPKNSAATLLKRRVSKPRRKPGRAPVP